jgi:uncharacterized membrane protein
MKSADQKHRIIFIDLMRAFAVLQMVQGHTINVLLAEQFRNTDHIFYAVWHFMRGMTAPIFMFTAGTVFTYLFRSVKKPFNENPRVKKGIKRGLLLLALGYALRYPTWTVFDFSEVSELSWKIFQAVDVLHLIGISLLIVLLILYLAEKTKISDTILFAGAATLIFFSSSFVYKIDWLLYFPQFIASYFYTVTGSLFPVFPWAGYVIAGGVLGSYLAKNPMVFKTKKFSLLLALFGCLFMLVSLSSDLILNWLNVVVVNAQTDPGVIVFRIGFVLLLNALVSFIALKVERIPQLLILVGRNTLLIYVVHLIILYGSAWNRGINFYWGKTFDEWLSVLAAIIMIALMTLMVIGIHKLKIRNKGLVT